ncbi:putative tRNA pseudouridine(13) synthase [Helianthus annuus]|nr:putative tRNA pseudouridine(13) synthase [Helianthus annuus]
MIDSRMLVTHTSRDNTPYRCDTFGWFIIMGEREYPMKMKIGGIDRRSIGLLTTFPAVCHRQVKVKPSSLRVLLKPYDYYDCLNQSAAMKSPLEESDVGISCYISPLPGFRGILKQRYSDFVVNEVDLNGNVIHLTSLEAPTEVKQTAEEHQLNGNHDDEIESFRALAGDSDANSLKEFIDKATATSDGATSILLSSTSDKLHRTAMHNFFKEKLNFLVTDTVDGPEPSSKCIRVRLNSGASSKKRKGRGDNTPYYDSRGSDHWPDHLGKFLRFHLCKENKDTQEALGLIGKMLGIQPRSFGFSGTKDKRAVTTQQVTVFKQRANRLASLNSRLIGIKVGDFCYVNEGLVLGQLHGNRFTITLRGVVADSEDTVKAAADALGKHGFINYFGMQRFGTGSVPTHLIGAKLLRGEWKEAVSMILDPRDGEKDDIRRIREYYKESEDIDGTLRQLPRFLVAEKAILQCLKKSPGNYLQAMKAVPRTLRMMYVHSYQSYLWNHAASMRVQKYGTEQVVLRDLVYCNEESCNEVVDSEFEALGCNDSSEINHLDEVDAHASEGNCTSVKVVNSEDLASGRYTYTDVVLPLPGSRVIYPQNDIEQCYQDLANKDGVSLTESMHNVKEFSLTSMTGAYRRVFGKAKDFEWELIKYKDVSIPLTRTDLDIVTKANKTQNEEAVLQGEQLALKLSFTLAASCYATMAIRELLKTSTSVAFHKALNQ